MNLGLLHCTQVLYHLSHQRSPVCIHRCVYTAASGLLGDSRSGRDLVGRQGNVQFQYFKIKILHLFSAWVLQNRWSLFRFSNVNFVCKSTDGPRATRITGSTCRISPPASSVLPSGEHEAGRQGRWKPQDSLTQLQRKHLSPPRPHTAVSVCVCVWCMEERAMACQGRKVLSRTRLPTHPGSRGGTRSPGMRC